MKSRTFIVVGLLVFAPVMICADDKKDAIPTKSDEIIAKILGKWEVTKADDEAIVGAMIEFAKNGKLIVVGKANDQEFTITAKYKIVDGKLITESEETGSSDTDTFKKLTENEMILENNDKKVTELKRKK